MALIVRIDVDRPYGREPLVRHLLSRVSSDLYLPKIAAFGYLNELKVILQMLNNMKAKAYVFFRFCTLPTPSILQLLAEGGHEIGLHLEDSRSLDTFRKEKQALERHIGKAVTAFSKHGSGGDKYGFSHHAPYEPKKYIDWAKHSGMTLFLGNLEDPSIKPYADNGMHAYPSAFWLEPAWRDTQKFTVDWLTSEAKTSDIVLLMHPENVLADPALVGDLKRLLSSCQTKVSL